MPELPEVEVVRRGIEKQLIGAQIKTLKYYFLDLCADRNRNVS